MDRKLRWETASLVLLLASFPVISAGASGGSPAVWWTGFAALVVGAVLPVGTRFMDHSGDRVRDAGLEFDDRAS